MLAVLYVPFAHRHRERRQLLAVDQEGLRAGIEHAIKRRVTIWLPWSCAFLRLSKRCGRAFSSGAPPSAGNHQHSRQPRAILSTNPCMCGWYQYKP